MIMITNLLNFYHVRYRKRGKKMVETSKRLKGAIDMHIHSAQMYGREKQ